MRNGDTHLLFKKTDYGCPADILDRNGEVVLGLCRKCNAAESELSATPCPPFIVFEGGEGAGKTTQIERLVKYLSKKRIVLKTREPGGSEGAELIRSLLVSGDPNRWAPHTEALLFMASRADHIERTLKPAFRSGHWVISDRFSMSSFVYQGASRGFGLKRMELLHKIVFGDFAPDLTILLDVDPEVGLARSSKRGGAADRFEKFGRAFHSNLAAAYRMIALTEPNVAIINANLPADDVTQLAINIVEEKFAGR